MKNILFKAKENCIKALSEHDTAGKDSRPSTFKTLFFTWTFVITICALSLVFAHSINFGFSQKLEFFFLGFAPAIQIIAFAFLASGMKDSYAVFMAIQYFGMFLYGNSFCAFSVYATATLNYPLIDDTLIKIDSWLNFDWLNYVAFVAQYPRLQYMFDVAYSTMVFSITIAICSLVVSRNSVHLQRFAIVYFITLPITIVLACFFPALGGYVHYDIIASDYGIMPSVPRVHEEHMLALRSGVLNHLPQPGEIKGLITFPSFHAAVGLILIWGFYPVVWLRIFMTALNTLLIIATAFDGGHYLTDVLAGLMLAFSVILFSHYLIPELRNKNELPANK